MIAMNTVAEVIEYLERSIGPCRPALPPMTAAEIREVEEVYAAAPPLAEWTDVDVDAVFADRDEFGEEDTNPNRHAGN